MKKTVKRVYFHYSKCEEYKSNMWGSSPAHERDSMIERSASLMRDIDAFTGAMMIVIKSWPNSCAANLTATGINHQAWMGHAACAINHGAPEDSTRLGWRSMTEDEQNKANAAADAVIEIWRNSYKGEHECRSEDLGLVF